MNLDSIRGNEAWTQFMRTAEAARQRNMGLNRPVISTKATTSNQKNRVAVNPDEYTLPVAFNKNAYSVKQTAVNERIQILGTRFDAFA